MFNQISVGQKFELFEKQQISQNSGEHEEEELRDKMRAVGSTGGKMGNFWGKMGEVKIWINFVAIFVHSFPSPRIAQTTLIDIVIADLPVPDLLFSSNHTILPVLPQ